MLQQIHYQTLRPQTTAHLAQTMTLLSLTVEELRNQIEMELSSNPALELVEERRCPTCHRLLPKQGGCPVCSCPQNNEPVVFISAREDCYFGGECVDEDDYPDDEFAVAEDTLPTYVLRQIAPELSRDELSVAAYLLTHMDEDGLLTVPLVEIAHYCHVSLTFVQRIQQIIQRADPIGVGSSSPQEALLVQLDVLSESRKVPQLAREMIEEAMGLLSRRQYAELARQFHIPIRQVQQIVNFIGENLNPFPGRSSWGDVRQSTKSKTHVYHHPDILIYFANDDPNGQLMVEIIMPISGTLRVNPLFREALQQTSEEKREACKEDLERASLFVKCLQQRNHTMRRLVQRVVMLQKDFILHGERYLNSITRVQIARELNVHESTISRAVANKTVQLPNRKIIPLSAFFDRSLNVRSVLCDLIAKETKPLSDSELVELLAAQGFQVARRTVAKYRAMEGILPAHLRRAVSQAK